MKVDMRLELKDVPGSLIRALEPISLHGGNIVSVTHSRSGKDLVSVQIGFSVPDQQSLDRIKKDVKKNSVHISEILLEGKKYYSKTTVSAIMVGHVIDKDIRDTIDRINAVGIVSSIDVVMPAPEDASSVIMNIDVDNGGIEKLNDILTQICDKKSFLLIRSL
jgi:ACT domain-containing protein